MDSKTYKYDIHAEKGITPRNRRNLPFLHWIVFDRPWIVLKRHRAATAGLRLVAVGPKTHGPGKEDGGTSPNDTNAEGKHGHKQIYAHRATSFLVLHLASNQN